MAPFLFILLKRAMPRKGHPTMPVEFTAKAARRSLPVHLVRKDGLAESGLDATELAWAKANDFTGEAGKVLILPGADGAPGGALFGLGRGDEEFGALAFGALAKSLPEGSWHFASPPAEPTLAAVGLKLGGYVFTRYGKKGGRKLSFALPKGADTARA